MSNEVADECGCAGKNVAGVNTRHHSQEQRLLKEL